MKKPLRASPENEKVKKEDIEKTKYPCGVEKPIFSPDRPKTTVPEKDSRYTEPDVLRNGRKATTVESRKKEAPIIR